VNGPRILLVVGGGIAAYKSCELVRLIRRGGGEVSCVLTEGGSHFVTAMSLAALSENPVHTTLWDLRNEVEMGHIQLSRDADLIVVCPATADLLAKMACGIADDLATTLLLATDKPVLAVPAMNVRMWQHAATSRNIEVLRAAGVGVMDPDEGPMACGEFGPGRLPEPWDIWTAIATFFGIEPGEPPTIALAADRYALPLVGHDEEEALYEGPSLDLGSIIKRSTIPGESGLTDFDWDDETYADLPLPEAEPAVPLNLGGPLLSKKGGARAAPPTDPDAINHLVSQHDDPSLPEPFAEEIGSFGEGVHRGDPLDGQPDFDGDPTHRPLYGRHVLVTAGPTHEPIDPVRYIANRSSGKQGFAIAAAAAAAGARVTLVSGPVHLQTPRGVDRIDVESAREMAEAVKEALPADVAIMVAAVADWRTDHVAQEKMKKRGSAPPALLLTENPDILASVAGSRMRPKLLIGFAAETEHVLDHAIEKRKRKGADWIIANDVSGDVMGGALNTVHIVTAGGIEDLPQMPKEQVARAIVERIAHELA
jgi:phosphopantothenoylcysteine decarboxylase/phosphopantothenate--cysteine ligase